MYNLPDVISFYKDDEPLGALSNIMGKYFHLQVNDVLIRSSELVCWENGKLDKVPQQLKYCSYFSIYKRFVRAL